MNCRDMEMWIALRAEGDLPAAEEERVREHLDACAACRSMAAELAESQAALKALGDEAVDGAALAAWRKGLMDRVEARGARRRFAWGWAFAAAAAAVVLVFGLSQVAPRRVPQPAPPVVARMTPPPPEVLMNVPSSPGMSRGLPRGGQPPHRRHVRSRPPEPQSEPQSELQPTINGEPLLVKLETSDPNVIIYWIVEKKGS